MKKTWKYVASVVLPLTGISALLGACSSMSTCNNDACYDRNISSVDPYKKGDIATWGTEKKIAEWEEAEERRQHLLRTRHQGRE
jgi:hypothetical protein